MAIQLGSRGQDVRDLQLKLKALGYQPGDIDGIFGPNTEAALKKFQDHYDALVPSGVLDAETSAALAQALVIKAEIPSGPVAPAAEQVVVPCDPAVWTAFQQLVTAITSMPVRYGPGRGLFHDAGWVVTRGPGALGSTGWSSLVGGTYPSFHCSSWTNFFLGWLLRYNERFTHAGNIPSLFDLCEQSDDLHTQHDGGPYRGYGPHCTEIKSNGETFTRKRIPNVLDIRELYDRRQTLPTFVVCGQSTHLPAGWRWWHHTLLFAIDHTAPGAPMHRLAADGYHASDGRWSATPMQWIAINEQTIPTYQDNVIYRGYGVISNDGSYGDGRPLFPVTFES
jgi:hypothetical protein